MTAEFLANANTKTIPIAVAEAVTKNSFPVTGDTFQKLHRFLPIRVQTQRSDIDWRVQSWAKKLTCLAKQEPDRVKQKILAIHAT